jgi:hypothetical protein
MLYRYKASITGNKIFMREYEALSETTLYDFHLFLQNDLGFAPDQLVLFRGYKVPGEVNSQYGLFDFGNGSMDTVKLSNLVDKKENMLHYVYDIRNNRHLVIELIDSDVEMFRGSFPRVVMERGKNPEQFSDRYDDFESLSDLPDHGEPLGDEESPEGEE